MECHEEGPPRRRHSPVQLVACGWQVEVADARKVKTVAPLAAKTDKVDARSRQAPAWLWPPDGPLWN